MEFLDDREEGLELTERHVLHCYMLTEGPRCCGWSSGSEPGLVITRASGALVWDSKGNEYIDCTSMAWSNNIGASVPEVIEAAFAQARQLSHLRSNFDSIPLLLLSKAMTDSAPGDLKRIGFILHGSLAVEMAMKLAMLNRPQHTGPWLALTDGYHGRSLSSMGLGWPHTNHAFDRSFPAVLRIPQPYAYRSGRSAEAEVDYCTGELRDAIGRRATGLPPALFMEPVQGNGTQLEFPRRYYYEVRQICTEHDIVLVFDEVQTGFGRTGKMWAAEHYGVTPDILVFGKGVGGGFPLAGILSSTALGGFQPGDEALTFGEFPVSLAAGLAALEVLERDGLLQACDDMGQYASRALRAMKPRHPLIGDIRGPTAIFFLLPSLFGTAGAAGVWLWSPCAAGVFLIVLVYAHLAARIPITGFAYQWNSRLINPHYGWFTGYTALLAFIAGTAATAVALASVFASDIWKSPTHGDIVLLASAAIAVAALINIVSIRAVSAVNNTGVFFEIVGSVGAAALLVVRSV